jgi:hypothetical protein
MCVHTCIHWYIHTHTHTHTHITTWTHTPTPTIGCGLVVIAARHSGLFHKYGNALSLSLSLMHYTTHTYIYTHTHAPMSATDLGPYSGSCPPQSSLARKGGSPRPPQCQQNARSEYMYGCMYEIIYRYIYIYMMKSFVKQQILSPIRLQNPRTLCMYVYICIYVWVYVYIYVHVYKQSSSQKQGLLPTKFPPKCTILYVYVQYISGYHHMFSTSRATYTWSEIMHCFKLLATTIAFKSLAVTVAVIMTFKLLTPDLVIIKKFAPTSWLKIFKSLLQ